MVNPDIYDEIQRLRQAGTAFCIATVVRTADATSAKAGEKAAVTDLGTIIGHLGGACVERALIQAAHDTLRSGAPRVIRVEPDRGDNGLTRSSSFARAAHRVARSTS